MMAGIRPKGKTYARELSEDKRFPPLAKRKTKRKLTWSQVYAIAKGKVANNPSDSHCATEREE